MTTTFVTGVPPIGITQGGERPGRIEYLYLTPEQRERVQELNDAYDDLPPLTRVRCQIPRIIETHGKKIEYYPHMDYDERTPPTQGQADLMCRSQGVMCPLAKECLALGLAIEAPTGVWGGRVLVDGKDYYKHGEEE